MGTHGAVAAISRDRDGVFQGASTTVFPTISCPTTLEAMTVREALALAEDLYNQCIHVASDCKIVVNDVKSESCARYGAIIREIKERASVCISCDIVHDFRSSTHEAHSLVKHALTLGVGCHVWLDRSWKNVQPVLFI